VAAAAARRTQDLARFPLLRRRVAAELRACLGVCGEVEHYSVSTVMREALEQLPVVLTPQRFGANDHRLA
jgi:hypothetical protein